MGTRSFLHRDERRTRTYHVSVSSTVKYLALNIISRAPVNMSRATNERPPCGSATSGQPSSPRESST
jgi:hypothetical protein